MRVFLTCFLVLPANLLFSLQITEMISLQGVYMFMYICICVYVYVYVYEYFGALCFLNYSRSIFVDMGPTTTQNSAYLVRVSGFLAVLRLQ